MLHALIVAAVLGQDLPQQSRKFFEKLVDFAVAEGRLEIRRTCDDTELRAAFDHLWEKISVGRGSYSHRGSSGSMGGSGDATCSIAFEPDGKAGHLSAAFVATGGEAIDLRQPGPGTLRLFYETGAVFSLLRQTKERCTLVIDNGHEVRSLGAASFQELMLQHPDEVATYVLTPLERWFAEAPLAAASRDVVEMALALRPVAEADAKALAALVEQLEGETLDAREEAAKALRERATRSAPAFHWLAQRADAATDGEVKSRLVELVKAAPRREAAYRLVVAQNLHRDLAYLAKILAAGRPAKARLEEITGKSFEKPEEWAAWLKENAARLEWDEKAFRWRVRE